MPIATPEVYNEMLRSLVGSEMCIRDRNTHPRLVTPLEPLEASTTWAWTRL